MAKQTTSFFLEEWLRSNSGIDNSVKLGRSSSAQSIIQAWADLRDSLQHQSFQPHHLQSLRTLLSSQTSLYVAEPQAKLLLSILSSEHFSLPHESYPLFLRLLYIWVRKSLRVASLVVDSAAEVLVHLFSRQFPSNKTVFLFSEGVLLVGALSFVPSASEKAKTMCLELLCRLLEDEYRLIRLSEELLPDVLAGIGYALSSCMHIHVTRVLDSLFGMWEKEGGPTGNASRGLMILHLVEWVLSNLINSRHLNKVDFLRREIFVNVKPLYASFAVIMASGGVLRVLNRSKSVEFSQFRLSAEQWIENVARDLVSRSKNGKRCGTVSRDNLLLESIALALARCGPVTYRASLLVTLSSALLREVFPLECIYTRILGDSTSSLLNEVKDHLGSTIFKEAGAITGALCNQYASADEERQSTVEHLVWNYCQDIYSWHRQVVLMLQGREDSLNQDLEKIAESAFLMVVVFALTVTKHRLDSGITRESKLELSVRILVSLSRMEYFRRMRLPEYMDTIRAVIGSVQEDESACISFVESIPSYNDLTNGHGFSTLHKFEYRWSADEVQTARVLFYLRVIPTCIERLPSPTFRKVVAPVMFLYMGHPNGKAARASHSLFTAFISSGKEQQDERVKLKEQLVFYYMQRSLEGYPGITPFEGMASGVAAVVRHLPAGSPSIFYCIQCLVDKTNSMSSAVDTKDADIWKNWGGDLEPSKKVLDLLLRLLSLVDIQVLPSLMKLLSQLVVQLPIDGQSSVLNELHQLVAESDDVIRKPNLVSWLQSLSFICSPANSKILSKGVDKANTPSVNSADSLGSSWINARL